MRISDWSSDVCSSDLVWRYARGIRVPASARVSLGEGMTPLVPTAFAGGRPRIKCEHLAPSGSFKDRGMTVMVSYLKACGVGEVMLDSSGNAAASLACYAAAAGLKRSEEHTSELQSLMRNSYAVF